MIANHVPSLITSTAATVAARAWTIFLLGKAIEGERSTMMISALLPAAPGSGGCVPSDASAVTVTTALT